MREYFELLDQPERRVVKTVRLEMRKNIKKEKLKEKKK